MIRFTLACIRIIALCLSFLLSTFAASLFLAFILFLGEDFAGGETDPALAAGTMGVALAFWFESAKVLFAPFFALIILAEFLRWSSLISNLLLGGLFAIIFIAFEIPGDLTNLFDEDRRLGIALLAAGFVGGFSHWLFSGHRAGRWLGPKNIQD